MTRGFAGLLCVVALMMAAACGEDETGTSPSSTAAAATTERFDAVLNPGQSAFYSFQVGSSGGAVMINLASLSPLSRAGALPVTMELGYGVPVGEKCAVENSVQTIPGLASQLTGTLTAGIHCANLADVGNLTEPVNFVIRITHP
jgi:hypothetical protein